MEKGAFMNILLSLLCILVALFSSYILKIYRDINDDYKTGWKEKFVYVICTGVILCSLTLSYALFVVWDNQFRNNILVAVTLLSIVFTIVGWILCYLKKSNIVILISMGWGILMCCYVIYLFAISFVF
ncbi:7TM diverse intracellular signaling domain-containing protein [Listeria innocua]|uniref:7TM diverse intracellular signaling domain-containing protein n=2 Tax=Listeria innocua TaxID=1642 RepID=UPI00396F4BBF